MSENGFEKLKVTNQISTYKAFEIPQYVQDKKTTEDTLFEQSVPLKTNEGAISKSTASCPLKLVILIHTSQPRMKPLY